MSSIDLSPLAKCTKLWNLELNENQLSSIDLSPLAKCTKLEWLCLSSNQLSSIDLSPLAKCTKLESLEFDQNTSLLWKGKNKPVREDLPEIIKKHYDKIIYSK